MEYSERKKKFIELTTQYIKDIEPLLEINRKTVIDNIRFFMYKAMTIQKWHKEGVSLDAQGIHHHAKRKKNAGTRKVR